MSENMKIRKTEEFIRGVKATLDGEGAVRDRDVRLRNEKALAGINPCCECHYRKKCVVLNCMPYYLYFRYRWKNLQRRLQG